MFLCKSWLLSDRRELLLCEFVMSLHTVCLCHEASLLIVRGERDVAGMKDLGLYRVSGVLSEIQKLKKAFEKGGLKEKCI